MGLFSKRRPAPPADPTLAAMPPPPARPAPPPPAARGRRGAEGIIGSDLSFVIVDVETSGLDPDDARVIEIALVGVNSRAQIEFEWSSLVSGDGVAGRTDIHGIRSEWLAAAPTFAEIAPALAPMLAGRVPGAHNAEFDFGFVDAEFERIGHPTGDYQILDTMQLAQKLGLPSGLARACAELGISYPSHTALNDARAAAALLCRALGRIDPRSFAGMIGGSPWPILPPTEVAPMSREEAARLTTARDFLEAYVAAYPDLLPTEGPDPAPAAVEAYAAEARAAVADGYVSPDEQQRLLTVARSYGMTVEGVRDAHQVAAMGLFDEALADNKMAAAEKASIQRAAIWLGVDVSDWDAWVKATRQRRKARIAEFKESMTGQTVAFSGRGVHPANIREALATKNGIAYRTTVSEACCMLVVGSTSVTNAQTEKAAALGMTVMVEGDFWRLLGEM